MGQIIIVDLFLSKPEIRVYFGLSPTVTNEQLAEHIIVKVISNVIGKLLVMLLAMLLAMLFMAIYSWRENYSMAICISLWSALL